MSTTRLEAFSDGVYAIVVTLLILDLRGPTEHQSIADALSAQGFTIAAYVVAFLSIGVLWINHHSLFRLAEQVDRLMLFTNLVLLLTVSATPFTASLFAQGLDRGGFDAKVGAAAFSTMFLATGTAYGLLWLEVTRPGFLVDRLDPARARRGIYRFGIGTVIYAALVALSFLSPIATLSLHGVTALYYAFDQIPERAYRREEISGG